MLRDTMGKGNTTTFWSILYRAVRMIKGGGYESVRSCNGRFTVAPCHT